MQQLQTPTQAAEWLRFHVKGSLRTDSRQVGDGDGFIAWPGATVDGRRFVPAALQQGAAACLVEQLGYEPADMNDARIASYAGLKDDSGPIAAAYYEHPSRQIDVLAVTGTNGKTTTTWWLAQALSALPRPKPCGLIGTLGVGQAVPGEQFEGAVASTGLTTPDAVLLQATLRRFADAGLVACAMEASSIGIAEHRLDGTRIHTAVFTNFTQDHLDYHGSMQAYWLAKAALFDWPELKAVVLNLDDERGVELAAQLQSRTLDLWTVSSTKAARLRASDLQTCAQGLRFRVHEGVEQHELSTQAMGHYNVNNLLGVIAAMRTLGVPLAEAVHACSQLHPVPGRMESVSPTGPHGQAQSLPLVVVDYAHTPDALAQALQALQPQAALRGGQLWCVFGCGGDRDVFKRPLMGAMAGRYADRVVVTSDNPRHEKPEAIISQILLGLEGRDQVEVQADRALAIAQTLEQAGAQDVVLVAGKGHEDYQELAGQRLAFSDRLEVGKALQARRSAANQGGHA